MKWSDFTVTDWQSVVALGEQKPSSNAQCFIRNATHYMKKEPHCFWSGRQARKKAYEQTLYICDNKVPFVSFLFERGKELKDPLIKQEFFFATSRIFALFSTSAFVCLSSDKDAETPGFTIGTNFWEAELPILWKLKESIPIFLIFIDKKEIKMSLSQKELMHVPIYRRYAHPMDSEKKSFVEDHYKQEDYDQWRISKPRRGILFRNLLNIFCHWKSVAVTRSRNKFLQK